VIGRWTTIAIVSSGSHVAGRQRCNLKKGRSTHVSPSLREGRFPKGKHSVQLQFPQVGATILGSAPDWSRDYQPIAQRMLRTCTASPTEYRSDIDRVNHERLSIWHGVEGGSTGSSIPVFQATQVLGRLGDQREAARKLHNLCRLRADFPALPLGSPPYWSPAPAPPTPRGQPVGS
jgi:hypothetical protein